MNFFRCSIYHKFPSASCRKNPLLCTLKIINQQENLLTQICFSASLFIFTGSICRVDSLNLECKPLLLCSGFPAPVLALSSGVTWENVLAIQGYVSMLFPFWETCLYVISCQRDPSDIEVLRNGWNSILVVVAGLWQVKIEGYLDGRRDCLKSW